ncbi:MAG: flagellar biosynthesis protein FlhB [Clostridiales bacterium]|nr:flagellar biosynthesis protein FlhB [Clostridiales bacterium]
MSSQKTEKATPKRRKDERKKGNVFQGREINIAITLLVMFVALRILGKYMLAFFMQTMGYFIAKAGEVHVLNQNGALQLMTNIFLRLAILVLPLLLLSALTYFLLSGIQTRFIFSTKKIKFKASRLNPITGIKNKFSMRSAMHLLKSIVTVIVVGVVIYNNIVDFAKTLPAYYFMPVSQSVFSIAATFYDIFVKVCIVIIGIGILDWFFQWWQHEKDLRMTKQEVKEEYKMTEGDPQIKSAIRSRQQRMAQRRMMQKVPQSDVVIVNPEHYAVALKYDEKKDSAPVVLAKGVDYIALKIKEIAGEHDIKIEENPPLARALYKAGDVGKEIPAEFYQAVAEILSYVYSLRRGYAPRGKTNRKR